jgi:hypothetical protein
MPLPKRLTQWSGVLKNVFKEGRKRHGLKYTMKMAMVSASKVYKKMKGKTMKKHGGNKMVIGGNKMVIGGNKMVIGGDLGEEVEGGRKSRKVENKK